MEKNYNPALIEQRWYSTWENSGYFMPKNSGASYCLMLPPPNVTGTLHMGHGFQVSLMDALVRYHRMRGFKTLWQVGTDHAGIATQLVVERQLLKKGVRREDMGREAFIEAIWAWKEQSDGTIKSQLRRMGASVDWTRECFSLDEEINRAVLKVFVELYDQGLIYRGKRLVNWDPTLLTAVSDLEVIPHEEEGWIWHLRYPLENGHDFLVVATTRPETMLGDVAIAVHPDDARYQRWIGKKAFNPLTGQAIPVIADSYVDPEFGSGCVKITPAHDFNDYAIGQRHQLPMINIFTPNAHINDQAPQKYQGLDRYTAREKILTDLENGGFLIKTVRHTLNIPRGEKSNAVLEPYLTDQWYIQMLPLKDAAYKAVQNGDIELVPQNWQSTYFQWLDQLEDWCISRQLWWGHRIPAWYDPQGNHYVADSEIAVRKKYGLPNDLPLIQDNDVLDTWFSASLWPFATLGWPEDTQELSDFYPTNDLVTGFDILFFWVARMIMMGIKFTGKVPFRRVYLTGLIRDSEGQKMSKTRGNTIDPIDLIDGIDLPALMTKRTASIISSEKATAIAATTQREFPQGIAAYGADALRFTYCALANTGRNIRFDMSRLEGYRHFCNKLWNAARYVWMNTEDFKPTHDPQNKLELSVADRWIISRLQQVIESAHRYFAEYRFDLLAQTLYEFTWNEYCDWCIELSKPVLTHPEVLAAQKRGTQWTLLSTLETLLRLLHPLMPFITEEIWQGIAQRLGYTEKTIMLQNYPECDRKHQNPSAEADIQWLQKMVLSIRQIRSEMTIPPGKLLPLCLQKGTDEDKTRVQNHEIFLSSLAKLSAITWLPEDASPPPAAAALVQQLELWIPLEGIIDVDAEIHRLEKKQSQLKQTLERTLTKINDPNFAKAPLEVIEKEKLKREEIQSTINKLTAQIERLKS